MNLKQFKEVFEALWNELPPNGSAVNIEELYEILDKHLPDAKIVRFDENGKEIV